MAHVSYHMDHDGAYTVEEASSIGLYAAEDARIANGSHPFHEDVDNLNCPCGCSQDDLAMLSDATSSGGWSARDYPSRPSKTGTSRRKRPGPKLRKIRLLPKGEKLEAIRQSEIEKSDKYLRQAFSNMTQFDDISLRDLVNKKKAGKARRWPRHLQKEETYWPSSGGHLAVDKDGLPLVVHVPNFVGPIGRRRLYRGLRAFGREVGVKIRRGADAGKRDNIKGYPFYKKEGYINGIFQLVGAWTAIGHPDDEPVPASDVLRNGRLFRTSMNLLRELSFRSSILDHVLSKLDAAAYAVLHEGRARLIAENAAYAAVTSLDPTYMHGRSISFNRATRNHEDVRDPPEAWTPILVLGKFKRGGKLIIQKLGLSMSYFPGTLIFVRGAVLPHEVDFFYGGQRISIAHFVHKAILRQVGITEIPISSYKDSPYHVPTWTL
ncbi:hypothetical protein AURDEDRAFT_177513 [Auricularia subglabra TFB-10046 SS5]|uniref:2OGFeDO JBP1/TET oxygenase domain-containing protein n=1 Tax=Auricularia subglabra (strain TFB-10046 / SS5) TaxID=717982 RepID=J0CSZ1_AURST|nr:hypothetical protein AURDEDRAFT_177513 [Auricularia subglabra TFB-10046 SS5]